jgi:hypothetical protein
VLFGSLNDLVDAFCVGVSYLTGDRSRMRFMFDHDDLISRKTNVTRRKAA